jgi:hypothetical protein
MKTRLLADNWTLQNAGEFLCNGLDGDTTHELVIPEKEDAFQYRHASADVMRFDALCQLLTHLVLADEVWVDGSFTDTWTKHALLNKAKTAGVVVPKPFKDMQGHWIKAREAMGDRLCVNKSLLKAHRKNKRQWKKDESTPDPMLSQLLWGGAGMLARADFFGLPYSPHPMRAKLFQRARFMQGPESGGKLAEFVTSQRLKIYKQVGKAGFVGTIHLPPVVVQVIEASQQISDLIPTALQLRDTYPKVREWLAQLQRDLNHEDMKKVLRHEKRLQSVARHLDSYSAVTPPGDTTVQFGTSWAKIGFKGGSPLNAVQNLFGMRAEINRLVLAPAGHRAIMKLLRMMGEQNTKRGGALKDELVLRSAPPTT